jgi:hypothetical protein
MLLNQLSLAKDNKTIMSQVVKFARITSALFIAAGAAAFFLYFGMIALRGQSPIIVAIPLAHIAPYLDEHPIPYLLTIAFIFAVVGALWLMFIMPRFTRFRFLQIMLLPWITLLVAGPVWGMLWTFHDMQAGFFPSFPQMINYLFFGAQQGLLWVLIIALYSLPFSILAYAAACLMLIMFVKRFGPEQPERAQISSA